MGSPSILEMIREELPLDPGSFSLPPPSDAVVGLVIVDEVKGFCIVGGGNLAPTAPNEQISAMVKETDRLARHFSAHNWPILALMDSHHPDIPEPPYPPHCIKGSGEDELVPDLQWLHDDKNAFLMQKDCIDGYIGGIQPDGSNLVADWVKKNNVQIMLVVGICTDVCVLDFVLAVLSARNHGILPPLREVLVYTEGCSTFDFPANIAKGLGVLPHPQELTHHMGLYLAKSRGAQLINNLILL